MVARPRTTSRRCRPAPALAARLGDPVAPRGQRRLDREGRRLEVVGGRGAGRAAELVPGRYTAGVLTVQRRDDERDRRGSRRAAARRPRRCPRTRARPPTRQNGTSAPSAAAAARSSKPAQRSTAAASAEPPPSPPPCGIRLSIVHVGACGRRARSARRRGSTRRAARPSANGPSTVRRRRRRVDRQRVVQVEA